MIGVDRPGGPDTGERLWWYEAKMVVPDLGELVARGAPK